MSGVQSMEYGSSGPSGPSRSSEKEEEVPVQKASISEPISTVQYAQLKVVKGRVPIFDPELELSIERFIRDIEIMSEDLPDKLKGDIVRSNVKQPSECYSDINGYASMHSTSDWSALKKYLINRYGDEAVEAQVYKMLLDPLTYKGMGMMDAFRKMQSCLGIGNSKGMRKEGLKLFVDQLPAKLQMKIIAKIDMDEEVTPEVLSTVNKAVLNYHKSEGAVTLGAKDTPKAVLEVAKEPHGEVNMVRARPATSNACYRCGGLDHYQSDCYRGRSRGGNRGGGRSRGRGRGSGRGGYRGQGRANGAYTAYVEENPASGAGFQEEM